MNVVFTHQPSLIYKKKNNPKTTRLAASQSHHPFISSEHTRLQNTQLGHDDKSTYDFFFATRVRKRSSSSNISVGWIGQHSLLLWAVDRRKAH